MMKQVLDETELSRIRSVVQGLYIANDVNVMASLYRAFEEEEDTHLYRIEIQFIPTHQYLCALLSMPDGHVFLDVPATRWLISHMIVDELDKFNAGTHWRYKGI